MKIQAYISFNVISSFSKRNISSKKKNNKSSQNMSAFFHVHDFKRVPKLNMCSTYNLLLDHRLSGFILNMQEHCK